MIRKNLIFSTAIVLMSLTLMGNVFAATKKALKSSGVKLSATSYTVQYKPNKDHETIVKGQKPTVTVKYGKTKLKKGKDYTLKYSNSSSGNAGTFYVTVKGKGKYKGSIKKSYKINPIKFTASNVKLIHEDDDFIYDGSQQVPSEFHVVFSQNGGTFYLTHNRHYTQTSSTITGNQATVGQKTVTKVIKGKGNFTGSATITDTYTIYPTFPDVELTGGTGKCTVKWEKSEGSVSGYGIFYWQKTKFAQILVDSKTRSKTITGLSRGKCYVAVVPYITVNKVQEWPSFGPDNMEEVDIG